MNNMSRFSPELTMPGWEKKHKAAIDSKSQQAPPSEESAQESTKTDFVKLTARAFSKLATPKERREAEAALAILQKPHKSSSSLSESRERTLQAQVALLNQRASDLMQAEYAEQEVLRAQQAAKQALEEILETPDNLLGKVSGREFLFGPQVENALANAYKMAGVLGVTLLLSLFAGTGLSFAQESKPVKPVAALDTTEIDSENSEVGQQTEGAGADKGTDALQSQTITGTETVSKTNQLTLTKSIFGIAEDGRRRFIFKGDPITVETAAISSTRPLTATIKFMSEGTTYTAEIAISDLAESIDSSEKITLTARQIEELVPLKKFVLRNESSPVNLRRGPGTNFPVAGAFTNKSGVNEVIEEVDTSTTGETQLAGIWYRLPDDALGGQRWVRSDLVTEAAATGGSETERRDAAIIKSVSNLTGVSEDNIKLHPDYTSAEQGGNPDNPTNNPPQVATDLAGNIIATFNFERIGIDYTLTIQKWGITISKNDNAEVNPVQQQTRPTATTPTAEQPQSSKNGPEPVPTVDSQPVQELQLGDPKEHALLLDDGTEAIPGQVFATGAGFYDVPENEQTMFYSLVAVVASEPKTEYREVVNPDGTVVPNARWVIEVVELKVPGVDKDGKKDWHTVKAFTHRALETTSNLGAEIIPVNNIFFYRLLNDSDPAHKKYFKDVNSLRNENAVMSVNFEGTGDDKLRFAADREEILKLYTVGQTVWLHIDFSRGSKPSTHFKAGESSVQLAINFSNQFFNMGEYAGYQLLQGGSDHSGAALDPTIDVEAPFLGRITAGEFRIRQ